MTVGDKWENEQGSPAFGLAKIISGDNSDINSEENPNILIQNWFQELKQKTSKSREK